MHGYAEVRLTEKLRKLANGRALHSAMHRVRRWVFRRRSRVPLTADAIIATIDSERFAQIRARHGVDDPKDEPPKYLEMVSWMNENLRRIRALELDLGRRKRVLDIGSGVGYFLYICNLLGHETVGIDLDEMLMFNEMIELLGVERRVWRVEPFVALPDLGRFDVVTGFQICFNGHRSDQLWAVAEWNFFLDDLSSRLNPGGRIWLEFNREIDGICFSAELEELFKSRGAEIVSNRVVFNQVLPAPLEAAPA
jgi:SAM-dependent methyltransferase